MHPTRIHATITQLVDFLIKEATPHPHKPMLTEFFWPEKKSWDPQISNFDDTGDILPFIAWAGVIFKKPSWLNFCRNQFKWWYQNARLPSDWYLPIFDHQAPSITTSHQLQTVSLYDHQDTLTGLYNLYLLTQDAFYSQMLDQLLKKFARLATRFHGIIPNKLLVLKGKEFPHPLSSFNPAVSGLVAEHLFLRGNQTGNQSFLKAGHAIIHRWLQTPLWETHHLFHQGYHCYLPQLSIYPTTHLMKANTNLLFALLQQPTLYQSFITLSVQKLLRFQHPSGAFFDQWNLKSQSPTQSRFNKTQNFAIIDLLIEISNTCKGNQKAQSPKPKALINAATACADFWISRQHPQTQLIPDYILPSGLPQYSIAKLDQSADLYSSFLRLYSFTKSKIYLQQAQLGAQVLQKYFGQIPWWHRVIDAQTGHPAANSKTPPSDHPAKRNLTKYVGGALRFYLSLWEVKHGKSMQEPLVWTLSRDR